MACSFNAAFFNYPVICTGSHFFGVSFSGALSGKYYNGTIKHGIITDIIIPVTSPVLGPLFRTLVPTALNAVYTFQLNECDILGNLICAFSPVVVNVTNYNFYNPAGNFGYNFTITQADCITGGTITIINTINGTTIPSPFSYYALRNTSGVILQTSGPVAGNTFTFTGIAPGNYDVISYLPQPPGHPQAGQQGPCFYQGINPQPILSFNIFEVCILKATDCSNPSVFFYFDGTVVYSLIINKTIKTTFPGTEEGCYLITREQGSPLTTLGSYYVFNDCDTCNEGGCSDITSTISGIDDRCDQKTGSVTVIPASGTAPYSYSWTGTGQTTQTITGLPSGVYTVIITDSNGCTGTNSIILNNLPCNKNYLLTPCDTSVLPFVITNPITSPDPNPDTYLGNIFKGDILLTSSDTTLTGCFNLSPVTMQGVPATITVSFYSYNTCIECNPLAWKISRCDDPNIFYFTNDNLTLLEGQVIKDVIIIGCDDTTYPCNTLPIQCWNVVAAPPGLFPVHITSYDPIIYPDCKCCKPC